LETKIIYILILILDITCALRKYLTHLVAKNIWHISNVKFETQHQSGFDKYLISVFFNNALYPVNVFILLFNGIYNGMDNRS